MGSDILVIVGLILSVLVLVLCTVKFKIHPFFALIATTVTFAVIAGMNMDDMLAAFTSGMGGTVADIGLVIALGTVTGALLEKSGAAETMARTILKITGEKHAALGLTITGYFVSIPVFCDSAFVLLSPIAKRLSKDTKISMTTMAIATCMGLHATHMFVPPTPGPLAVAGILSADLGQVILFGALVSIPVALVGYFAAVVAGKKYYYLPGGAEEEMVQEETGRKQPNAVMSFSPILVPIALMLLKTIGSMCGWGGFLMSAVSLLGTPAVALLIGLIIAAIGYHQIYPEDDKAWGFDGVLAEALRTAGQIVLIVGAGGAFSGVLKASSLRDHYQCILRTGNRYPGSVHHRFHFQNLRRFRNHRNGNRSDHDYSAAGCTGICVSYGKNYCNAGLCGRRNDGIPRKRRLLLGNNDHIRYGYIHCI